MFGATLLLAAAGPASAQVVDTLSSGTEFTTEIVGNGSDPAQPDGASAWGQLFSLGAARRLDLCSLFLAGTGSQWPVLRYQAHLTRWQPLVWGPFGRTGERLWSS